MGSKVLLILVMFMATILLISSEVAPKDLDEKFDTKDGKHAANGVEDSKYWGYYGGWPWYGGNYGGNYGYGPWYGGWGGWPGGWGGSRGWGGGWGGRRGWGGGWGGRRGRHDYVDAEPRY
ncbi:hypothetical protein VNO77_42221 [Canavalia gladiata]|uniref:Uncharacterized protein n=1 Tax=Canavalia gladiata TaxID=3824 RepID=A0AAN9K2W2_CANGL